MDYLLRSIHRQEGKAAIALAFFMIVILAGLSCCCLHDLHGLAKILGNYRAEINLM